jgi:copper chaperone CopZ
MRTTIFAGLLVFAAMLLAPAFSAAGDCSIDKGADCTNAAPKSGAAALQAKPGEMVYVLGIEGMSCPTDCAPKVKESIQSIEGVREVEVSFPDKRAIVHTDPNLELTVAKVDQSFKNQGYFVSSLEKVAPK